MSFIGNLLGEHTKNIASSIQNAVINADPTTAGEAEIQTIIDELGKANYATAEKQQALEAARTKITNDQKAIDDATKAVEILSAKPEKQAQANQLLTEIETVLMPRLESEKKLLATIENSVAMLAQHKADLEQHLSQARNSLTTNATELENAKLELDMANQQRDDAKRQAGFSKTLTGISVATDAMSNAAAKMRAKAEAAKLDAQSLNGAAPSATNPDIAAALAEARGQGTSTESIADRLARLRAKTAN